MTVDEGHFYEVDDGCSFDEPDGFVKSDVACICPKCLKVHSIRMHWIGRGTPRKFCISCRHIHYGDAY